ncbi:MAG: hypothetical protein CBC55_02840 [Gammaproteobacteria bacterium TMED95]|nr:MAG: hypothetical protein CBC55_02840 [Gammaproteobacteria bacterium TMED95]|tara:strand:+ start:6007 stop:6687 length:681 start_codon:yes stop_codon:yes gene_type:complete
MALRNITENKDDFSAFQYSLYQAIKSNPNMSQQQLGENIAKALGARSYNALNLSERRTEEHQGSVIPTPSVRLYALLTPAGVSVHYPNAEPAFFSLVSVLNSDDNSEDIPVQLFTSRSCKEAQTALASAEAAIPSAHFATLAIRELGETRNETLSDLAEDFQLNASALEAKYTQRLNDLNAWAEYPYAKLTRDAWKNEASGGSTLRSYWSWVEVQLEQLVDAHLVK